MTKDIKFEILLVGTPGLEPELLAEAKHLKFANPKQITGGVTIEGGWPDVWRANLQIRGSSRVLARIGSFHVGHLAQLDKLAHAFAWKKFLRHDVAVSVEAVCKKSKIYHSGAAAQRIQTAIKDVVGTTIDKDAPLAIKARIEKDLCTISIDTSGEMLHKRGHKEAVAKAPMRETLASLMLRRCGFDGHETLVDPMCGSGTFVIEAAEIANGFMPGRSRNFAFEALKSFDAAAWEQLKLLNPQQISSFKFYGSDRDAGAIKAAIANAERAGVSNSVTFAQKPISDLRPPEGPPGLVMVNPPYGLRIGDKKPLFALYETLGQVLLQRFKGWRVGLVTADTSLAKATKLPFVQSEKPILHGGLSVHLFRTKPLE
jgi:putative N6-adenine-specific DNA methylase